MGFVCFLLALQICETLAQGPGVLGNPRRRYYPNPPHRRRVPYSPPDHRWRRNACLNCNSNAYNANYLAYRRRTPGHCGDSYSNCDDCTQTPPACQTQPAICPCGCLATHGIRPVCGEYGYNTNCYDQAYVDACNGGWIDQAQSQIDAVVSTLP